MACPSAGAVSSRNMTLAAVSVASCAPRDPQGKQHSSRFYPEPQNQKNCVLRALYRHLSVPGGLYLLPGALGKFINSLEPQFLHL